MNAGAWLRQPDNHNPRTPQMKKPVILLSAIAAQIALIAAPALADVADIQWSETGSSSREFRVEPGKFAEWCGKLRAGEKITWRYESAAALNFNIHYHEGKEVRFPAKQDGASTAEGVLQVASDQDYCWMWTNKSAAPVALKATLGKGR